MSLIRRRRPQNKVYLPASARENQYMLARFTLTDELVEKYSSNIDQNSDKPYQAFYECLAEKFFKICDELEIENGKFVANDKFVRVRFCEEEITPQTEQQILFLYNPRYHYSQKSYFDATKRAKKFRLIFLANGDSVRLDAANFHKKVSQAITRFADEVGVDKTRVRVCDHQHLTFDVFAKEKGIKGTQTHKFRALRERYNVGGFQLPERIEPLTYAVVDMPLNRRIKQFVGVDAGANKPYEKLYSSIAEMLEASAKEHGLANAALVANCLVPIIRYSEDEKVFEDGELLRMEFNPSNSKMTFNSAWNGAESVNKIQFVFVATKDNYTNHGYGRFYSLIENTLKDVADKLEYKVEKEELKIRFHQHLGYLLEAK
ncbi:hypothetical protein C2869_16910 [Saccharobesus litoralis]|uniref:DUF3083 family protein n=1 Tax=Saccharobesus litoralis TaxID=2172099 RepID=A0A2S0VV73_9ALTE|nr:DUF3083 family protein [Saccharobesus litoralis]AWB68000.1 hypothetical protein C2869_16910 [Saccharobesus litoralis]